MITTPISQLGHHVGETLYGQYLLTRVEDRITQLGGRYKAIELSDYSGSVQVYAWPTLGFLGEVPSRTPTPAYAELHVRRLHDRVIANMEAVRNLEPQEITNAATMLPLHDCPQVARPALAKLVDFVWRLKPDVLRDFLNRVLLDPRIAPTFTMCKASQRHHHHEPGGLLSHSMEVMEIAGSMAANRLDATETAITEVAALLHDLGKLRTVGAGNVRPIHYLVVRHEAQTGRLLDPHMDWLRLRAPEIAAGLDYTLSFLERSPTERTQAQFLAPELIRAADQMSAALDNHRRLDDLLATALPRRHEREAAMAISRNNRDVAWL